MSTAQRELENQIYDGTVAKSAAASGFGGVDPRRRRYGYHPGIYRMEIEPSHSGQQLRVIPCGLLVPFRTATLKVENFDINVPIDEYHKQVAQDFTAKYFIENCKVNYYDEGFREIDPLTMLDDAVREENGQIKFENFINSPHGYFNAVHPSFGEIGHICPAGLINCATCRVQLLGTEDNAPEFLLERIRQSPDPELAENTRLVLLDANTTYRESCRNKWAVIIGEYDGSQKGEPGIRALDDSLHHIRKHLHETAPTERAALAAAGYGDRVAESQAQGMKELADAFRERPGDNNNEVLKMLAQGQQQLAEGLRQQGEMLANIMKGNNQKKSEKATEKTSEGS